VAIMGRSLRGRFSGVVRYTHELIGALAPSLGGDLTVFLTDAPDGIEAEGVRRVRAPFPTPNEYARAFWEQTLVPFQVARLRPDVFHSPNYILPVALSCPAVVTVHDLCFLDLDVQRLRSHLYLRALTSHAVRRAARVICVSEATRDDVVRHYPHAAERIRVIGEGVALRFERRSEDEVQEIAGRLGITGPYVLFVGTLEPRKNLVRLIRAFADAIADGELPHHLVIAGGTGWMDAAIREAWQSSPARSRIRFVGYVSEDDLPGLYSGADLFAYLSLDEGYGLPPLEAMACGAPVLSSSAGSLPEVLGQAAELVDPQDEGGIARALSGLLRDRRRRHRLARAGVVQASRHRWSRVAEQTMAVYREAAS
jgi:glycosyltransferase involved in cell wall biosynthesis